MLQQEGVHPKVVEHLVSAGAQDLLPGTLQGRKPPEPFRQLWIAAAMQSLDDVQIERLTARPLEPINTSLRILAGGVRLVLVEVPAGDALALGINGTPLMQMLVFGANGKVEEARPPAGGSDCAGGGLAASGADHQRGGFVGCVHPVLPGGSSSSSIIGYGSGSTFRFG